MALKIADMPQHFSEQVQQAVSDKIPLRITGSGSKAFYGRETPGDNSKPLSIKAYRGVVSHEPTELVVTARSGTRIADLEKKLAQSNQMLAFEPPHFGATATLGGTIACGFSGPRRPYAGAARDFVLGMKMINGKGDILNFGGQVMKNVAGYDLSRLMTGALGTLGVILEVSLKILPLPATEKTLSQECEAQEAITLLNHWAGQPYPISAAVHNGKRLYVRLSGAETAVSAALASLGGEELTAADEFWQAVREQQHEFFQQDLPLWRLSLPPATPLLDFTGPTFIDWGGAQRWFYSDFPASDLFAAAAAVGGHLTLFRGGERQGQVFQPLEPVLQKLHQRLKNSFDPAGIFNPGCLYPDF